MVDLLEPGDADKRTFEVVGPAVVGAHEAGGVALLRPADGVATVAAGVNQDLRVAVGVAHDDDAVLADEGHEEVAGVGDLRFVGHEVPGPGEDPLHLEIVDVPVGEDAAIYRAGIRVYHAQHFFVSKSNSHEACPPVFVSLESTAIDVASIIDALSTFS